LSQSQGKGIQTAAAVQAQASVQAAANVDAVVVALLHMGLQAPAWLQAEGLLALDVDLPRFQGGVDVHPLAGNLGDFYLKHRLGLKPLILANLPVLSTA